MGCPSRIPIRQFYHSTSSGGCHSSCPLLEEKVSGLTSEGMVARGGIEPPTRGFSVACRIAQGLIFQRVTGASVAQYAGLCTAHSRKTHAHVCGQNYLQLWISAGVFVRGLTTALCRRLKIEVEPFDHFVGPSPRVSRKLFNKACKNTCKSCFHSFVGDAIGFGWRK